MTLRLRFALRAAAQIERAALWCSRGRRVGFRRPRRYATTLGRHAAFCFGESLAEQGSTREASAHSYGEIAQARLLILRAAEKMDRFGLDQFPEYRLHPSLPASTLCLERRQGVWIDP